MKNKAPQVYVEPIKLWNRSYILVLIMSTFNYAASQMVNPFISKYALSLGATMTVASTVAGLMSIVALFLRPVSGMCGDKFNRKKIITITSIITAVCMVFYATVDSVPALIVVRVVHGIVFSFSGVAMMAFNTSFMPKAKMGEGMGWMALSNIISSALGPNIGTWIVDEYGYPVCFVASAVICLITTLIILMIPYVSPPKDENSSKKFSINSFISLRILPYAGLMGLFSVGNGLVTAFLILLGDERGIENVALFYTAYSISMVAVRPFIGKLLDRKGLAIILYPSYVVASISMLLLGFANSLWMVILAGILKAIGQGSGSPSIQAASIKALGREKAGVVSSTCYIGQDLGNAIAPTLGGIMYSFVGFEGLFSGYAILLLVVGCLGYYLKSKYDRAKYGADIG